MTYDYSQRIVKKSFDNSRAYSSLAMQAENINKLNERKIMLTKSNKNGPGEFLNVFRYMAAGGTNLREYWRNAYRNERRAISHAVARDVHALRGSIASAQARLAQLAASVRNDVAPQLQAIRERDDFINSGKSLWVHARETGKGKALEPFKKLIAPPLPYVGKLPPNK